MSLSDPPTLPILDAPSSGQAAGAGAPRPEITAEVFSIPLGEGRFAIYAPLRRAAFVANARLVNHLADLREGVHDASNDPDGAILELLRGLGIVDGGPEPSPITTFSGEPRPTAVTLFLTTACNLRCTYCYASAGDTALRRMSLETAVRGIEFVASNAERTDARHFDVGYHGGGEPTANWETMTGSLARAREIALRRGLSMSASSATNGVLRDEQIDWILENLDGASLSFDGLPEVHDAHRVTVGQEGSSARVMRTMRRFDERGFRYGVRMTVTREHVARLPDSVEFILANFRPARVQAEPAYALGRWTDAPSAETSEFIDAFREARTRALRTGSDLHFSAARLDALTNHFCGITRDSFSLTPDGSVSACFETFSEDAPHADVFLYGAPAPEGEGDGYRFDMRVLEALRRLAVQHRPFCGGCFAKWHCAGDCHHKALSVNGPGEFRGTDRCHITREIVKDQILERIADSGGVVWTGAARSGGA